MSKLHRVLRKRTVSRIGSLTFRVHANLRGLRGSIVRFTVTLFRRRRFRAYARRRRFTRRHVHGVPETGRRRGVPTKGYLRRVIRRTTHSRAKVSRRIGTLYDVRCSNFIAARRLWRRNFIDGRSFCHQQLSASGVLQRVMTVLVSVRAAVRCCWRQRMRRFLGPVFLPQRETALHRWSKAFRLERRRRRRRQRVGEKKSQEEHD